MKTRKWLTLFILLFSTALAAAQQPVTGLVIRISSDRNDVLLNWSCPQPADSFQIHAGLTPDFQVGSTTRIGATSDTTFTHINGVASADKRFYAVTVFSSMVLVPAGPYSMGADYQSPYSLPIHTDSVSAFYMDIYEVTNAQYRSFCDATSRQYPTYPEFYTNYFANPTYANYPVVNVNWYDARAFAAWVGKRLPSEAEWERAAKGSADNRHYPWGDTWVAANANIANNPADGYDYTSPVGIYPNGVSPVGCYDMAGNVWEWCEDDWHNNYNGAPTNGSAWIDDPRGTNRVVRGGEWNSDNSYAFCADRFIQDASSFPYCSNHPCDNVGFRCAKSFVNRPPAIPSLPTPVDTAIGQSVSTDLSWTCSDPDLDPLTYDVYFGTTSSPPQLNAGQTSVSYYPGTLANITTYYWRVVTSDNHGNSTSGPVWSFSTGFAGMAYVPAGPYVMGSNAVGGASVPEHTVNVAAFYMDIYEVTNAQYRAFCVATGHAFPPDPGFPGMPNYFTDSVYANYPVVMVNWQDDRAYAAWAGKRLPSEAEWERAAKGSADNRHYPWGDAWVATNANIANNPADGYTYTSPVGTYPNGISPAGCYDMAGNVWEWCEDDWHDNYNGAPPDGSAWVENPRRTYRIDRGGSWNYDIPYTRCAGRYNYGDPASRAKDLGFRCAKTP